MAESSVGGRWEPASSAAKAESQSPDTRASGNSSDQAQEAIRSAADQAQRAMRRTADRASETLNDVSDQAQRYYQQGRRAVGNLDSTKLSGLVIAGMTGFAAAWLIFGRHMGSGDDVARRMSRSADHHR